MRTVQTVEQAQRLQDIGYDGWGIVIYTDHETNEKEMLIKPMNFPLATPAPLIAAVFEWAMKEKNIFVDIYTRHHEEAGCVTWQYRLLYNLTGFRWHTIDTEFATYEEAQDAALEELIQVLERQKKRK